MAVHILSHQPQALDISRISRSISYNIALKHLTEHIYLVHHYPPASPSALFPPICVSIISMIPTAKSLHTYGAPPLEPVDDIWMLEAVTQQLGQEKFSPAEIQGFLLMRKKEPVKALKEVATWRNVMLEAKDEGSSLIDTV